MEPEVHFGSLVLHASIGVGCCVVEELIDAKCDVFPRAGGY